MTLARVSHPVDFYVERLCRDELFSFSRWGDGEWAALLTKRPGKVNCDGHRYFAELSEDLRAVLAERIRQPEQYDYWVAMQDLALRVYGGDIRRWLEQAGSGLEWRCADVFHRASLSGQLQPLLDAMAAKPLLIVGPPHLRALRERLPYRHFVEVPAKNCYTDLARIIREVKAVHALAEKPLVVSLSASMPAEVIIHRLYPYLKADSFLLDFGSLWDPYVGVRSRKYHESLQL